MKNAVSKLAAAGLSDDFIAQALFKAVDDLPTARAVRRVVESSEVSQALEETVAQIQDSGMVQGTKWQTKMLAHYRPMRLRARRAYKAAIRRLEARIEASA